MSKDIKTFEQRMREHRQQYEQQRGHSTPGSGRPAAKPAPAIKPRPARTNAAKPTARRQEPETIKIEVDLDLMDEMYLHEQEDEKYIVMDHNAFENEMEDMDMEEYNSRVDAQRRSGSNTRQQTNQGEYMESQPMRQPQPRMSAQPIQAERNTDRQVPETLGSSLYTPGYLSGQIGKLMRVEFLIGTNGLNDRTGVLSDVGVSFIILQSLDGVSSTLCDIYSIKFVTIMENDNVSDLVDRL